MRWFKLFTGSLVLAIIGLFIWQNIPTFKTELPFTLDLYIREQLRWTHYLYTLILFFTAIGFIAGILLVLKPYFNVRRLLAMERQEKEQAKLAETALPAEKESSSP